MNFQSLLWSSFITVFVVAGARAASAWLNHLSAKKEAKAARSSVVAISKARQEEVLKAWVDYLKSNPPSEFEIRDENELPFPKNDIALALAMLFHFGRNDDLKKAATIWFTCLAQYQTGVGTPLLQSRYAEWHEFWKMVEEDRDRFQRALLIPVPDQT